MLVYIFEKSFFLIFSFGHFFFVFSWKMNVIIWIKNLDFFFSPRNAPGQVFLFVSPQVIILLHDSTVPLRWGLLVVFREG